MLIDFDHDKTLYILGDAAPAIEIKNWVRAESDTNIVLVSCDDFYNLPAGSQCMLGFQTLEYRKRLLENLKVDNYQWPTFVHPKAHVERISSLGKGCVVLNFVHVGWNSIIGDFCYLATGSQISHDSKLGKNCILSPGVIIGGATTFKDNIWVGLNSSFANKIQICSDTIFTMTSVVHKSVTDPGKYYGNRKIV